MFCWGTFSPAIHVDVTLTRATHLSTVPNHVQPGTMFSGGRGLFQRDNGSIHKAGGGRRECKFNPGLKRPFK